jgi:hypothetical protein
MAETNLNLSENSGPILVFIPSPADAFTGIRHVFRDTHMHTAHKHIVRWIDLVNSVKPVWRGNEGSDHLSLYGVIFQLLESAWMLHRIPVASRPELPEADIRDEDFLINVNPSRRGVPVWRQFRWELTRSERKNPYSAIDNFFKEGDFTVWSRCVHYLLHLSFSMETPIDLHLCLGTTDIRQQLLKLIEACYLVNLRMA